MENVNLINTKKNIRENVLKILSRITRIDYSNISDDVFIREELGIDSLIAIEIIANIEMMYDIEIDENLIADIEIVGDLINLIDSIITNKR